MFISHEGVAVNLDRVDYIDVRGYLTLEDIDELLENIKNM